IPLTPPPYGWAALVSAVVLAIYIATLGPTTAFWDTSEYIAAAKVLGIPHPPGNPLFVLMAHVWGLIPMVSDYATRINLFAAVTSALSAGLWFLVADRWMRSVVSFRPARLAAAFAGTLLGSTMWTVWNQSTVNEKVYTLSLLSMALVMWLAVHWADDRPGAHRDRWVILIAYVIALSSTNHQMGVLAAPGVAVYILMTDWKVITRWRVLVGVALAVAIGISINYLFLPIRAGQFPAINEGEPIGFFSNALSEVLGRVQYAKPSVFERQAELSSQVSNYLQYWSWQFGRDWPTFSRLLTLVFSAIGLTGLMTLIQKDRRAGLAALTMFATLTAGLIFYLNFRYGFSIDPTNTGLDREVRERDYFFICSFIYFGTLVAVGFGALMQLVADGLAQRMPEARRWATASPMLLLVALPIAGNWSTASRAGEYVARDFAVDLLESVAPYGILITAGDNDTFPLWYAQEVEGVRPDVTVANLSLMNTEWHLKQLRRRPTETFDPARSIPLWQSPTDTPDHPLGTVDSTGWVKPAAPVFTMTEAELASLPEIERTPAGARLQVGGINQAIEAQVLTRQDFATILLIRDNLGKRPIYFSWSAAGYPDQTFGLTEHLISEGLVRRLVSQPVQETGSVIFSPSVGFVDVARTRELMWNAYRWEAAARRRPRGWVDVPSGSILSLYALTYASGASLLRQAGDSALAARADSVATAIRDNITRGSQYPNDRRPPR
ncbi:MAG: DUF2723 domain-containing protein, partial [Gemmatimonadota bacterium]|nr:DUF2723 domain-containing protein [Gemmatimonadota bacterium]